MSTELVGLVCFFLGGLISAFATYRYVLYMTANPKPKQLARAQKTYIRTLASGEKYTFTGTYTAIMKGDERTLIVDLPEDYKPHVLTICGTYQAFVSWQKGGAVPSYMEMNR